MKKQSFFTDYNWETGTLIDHISRSRINPLFIAGKDNQFIKSKADQIADTVSKYLFQPGGLIATGYRQRSAMGLAERMGAFAMDCCQRPAKIWVRRFS